MHMSGLWFPLRLRSLNYKGCRAKAGTVQKDISTLKIERAGGKAVSLRAMEGVITTMPGQDSPEFTAPSHTVQTEKRYASVPPLKLQRFQMPYPSLKHFWNYGVGESALSILLFINCLQLFSMPRYPPSENQGERWQSKGQHRKHQEARKARSAGKYCFILFLQPLISMLKGSMWAEMLYFAFYTETMGTLCHFITEGEQPSAVLVCWYWTMTIKPAYNWKVKRGAGEIFSFQLLCVIYYIRLFIWEGGGCSFLSVRLASAFQGCSSRLYLSDIKYLRGLFPFQLLLLFIFLLYKLEFWWPNLLPTLPNILSTEFVNSCKWVADTPRNSPCAQSPFKMQWD